MTDFSVSTIQYLIVLLCLFLSTLSQNAQYYSQSKYSDYNLDSDVSAPYARYPENIVRSLPINVEDTLKKLNYTPTWVPSWPDPTVTLGQISAVSLDTAGNVVVFHRGNRVWELDSFSTDNLYQGSDPIDVDTVAVFNSTNGKLTLAWGRSIFYMPHGLTVDHDNNVWVTDVALHQVMKFYPNGKEDRPQLVLGKRFSPGSQDRFCKPTAVAVLRSGDFFVSDGYCNSRIVKYSMNGMYITSWGKHTFSGIGAPVDYLPYTMSVPHALALAEEKDMIMVADREDGRVICYSASNGSYIQEFHSPVIGFRLFSVAYTPINGGLLYVVNGPEIRYPPHPVRGFVISMTTGQMVSQFGPNNMVFSNPHDIAVSSDGSEVYVVEINPYKVHKFIGPTVEINTSKPTINTSTKSNSQSASIAKPTATVDKQSSEIAGITLTDAVSIATQPTATLLIIVTLLVVLVALILGIAALISRRRKRGIRNRRRVWDLPVSATTGIKFSNLMERRSRTKDGFEKVNTEESDEEPTPTTSMLSTPQFA